MKSKITKLARLAASGYGHKKNNDQRAGNKFLSWLLGVAFSGICFGQYHPMLENPKWIVTIANFGGSNNVVIQPGVDVVIGGVTYKKFIDATSFSNTEVFLREDVAAQKVYRRVNNQDVLLYDFSLTEGATLTLPNGLGYNVLSVTDIQSADGTTRKRIYLNNFLTSETWIEGVGSPSHPLRPSYELPSDPYIYTQCSFQGNTNIYNHGLVNTGVVTDCAALGQSGFRLVAGISPMPFSSSATLMTEYPLRKGLVVISNQLGQTVDTIDGIEGSEVIIQRKNLESGIYYLRLFENGQLMATTKIMVAEQ